MNYKNIFPPLKKVKKISCILAISALVSSNLIAAQNAKLVEVAIVESWDNGVAHKMHCEVTSPNIQLLSSHSAARLEWALPVGSQVIKGQLIARQDEYYIQQNITRLELEIERASLEQDYATQEHQRLLSLNKQKLVSTSQLNDMARLAKQATLSKKILVQQLKKLRYQEKLLQHFAPVSGEVMSMEAQPGQYLVDGETILRLQPTNNRELVCELPLNKYRQSNQLNKAKFTLHSDSKTGTNSYSDSNNEVDLRLIRQTNILQKDSQTLLLYLQITSDSTPAVFLGERLQVNISFQTSAITRIPNDALELVDDGYYVWRLNGQKEVNRLAVSIVSTQNDYFLVKSDLRDGDNVVTFGKQGLAEKQLVTLTHKGTQAVSL